MADARTARGGDVKATLDTRGSNAPGGHGAELPTSLPYSALHGAAVAAISGVVVRRVALVACALTGLVAQLLPVFFIAGTLVDARNAAGGECGYDGNCIDDGLFAAVGWTLLLVMAVEVGVALLVSIVRFGRIRPGHWSVWRFLLAALDTTCFVVCAGCAAVIIVAGQSALIDHLANAYATAKCPGTSLDCSSDTTRANIVLDWSAAAVLVEAIAAVIIGQRLTVRLAGRNRTRLEQTTDPTDETLDQPGWPTRPP